MPFAPFLSLFPDIASQETRFAHTLEGAFAFVELFCDEQSCDCRRAYFQVFSDEMLDAHDMSTPLATLTWGWEPPSFYKRWASFRLSKEDLAEMTGPAMARLAHQSPRAPWLLEVLRKLLRDENYRLRIIRHYQMFRDRIDGRNRGANEPAHAPPQRQLGALEHTPARPNEPCPCGSGRKYKKCCWLKVLQGGKA